MCPQFFAGGRIINGNGGKTCRFCHFNHLIKLVFVSRQFVQQDNRLRFRRCQLEDFGTAGQCPAALFKTSAGTTNVPVVEQTIVFCNAIPLNPPFLIDVYIFPKRRPPSVKKVKAIFYQSLKLVIDGLYQIRGKKKTNVGRFGVRCRGFVPFRK